MLKILIGLKEIHEEIHEEIPKEIHEEVSKEIPEEIVIQEYDGYEKVIEVPVKKQRKKRETKKKVQNTDIDKIIQDTIKILSNTKNAN